MKKPEYNSVTLTIGEGGQISKDTFPRLNGVVTGVSTHVIGDRPSKRARLALTDGGQEAYRPFDVAFSETEGRGSFREGVLPLYIPNPGDIGVSVTTDEVLAAGESLIVEVLLISEVETNEVC